ncbi:MAG: hypothetical protein KJO07_08950, partial [Deltaproteobacteria bacterium]|nr:hypothetical protein [Deltaproteobacteria bacterium]
PAKTSYLLLAKARAALHDWKGAGEALELARKRRADFGETADIEAQLATARGDLQRAMVIRSTVAQKRPNPANLGALAVAKGELGDFDAAERLFEEAIGKYLGPSPLLLAWLYFQRGLMWERAGRPALAAEHYQLGLVRFPLYAPLVGHLAGNLAAREQPDRAIELLEPLADSSEDPQYLAQLGELLIASGRAKQGRALIEKARASYAELLAESPQAFADHAVDFYLGSGRSPQRALELARLLVEDRPVDRSYQLLLRASAAAGESGQLRCKRADRAGQVRYPSAQLHYLRARGYQACKRQDDAKQALAAAKRALRQQ